MRSSRPMIAVMGTAGHVGGKVAELLLAQDEDVRVLEHRRPLDALAERGAHAVRGDAAEAESLRALFDGVDAALVLLPEDVTDPDFEGTRASRRRCTRRACRRRSQRLLVEMQLALTAAPSSAVSSVRPRRRRRPASRTSWKTALPERSPA